MLVGICLLGSLGGLMVGGMFGRLGGLMVGGNKSWVNVWNVHFF